ncbi:OmpH family outer membrane protein [Petrimonas sp.]|uniref:OmpH family outer membrane protein n=1 Tax=Petrimonas sp. TaxID=2023866 RepID=UPI003F514514
MNRIKLISLSVLLFMISATVSAQISQVTVAYVNTTDLLNAFPAKEAATQKLLALSENYKKELELMQNEYNKKYSDYITYQGSLAENIKLRRMQELTELENKMQQFMQLAQKDIEMQEKIMLEPLKKQISDAIRQVGIEQNYTVIYDLSNPGIAFVNPVAVDANPLVRAKLRIN